MKITGLESPFLKYSIERDGPQPDLPWHMAWRRVLEQAQWEERARYQSIAEAPPPAVWRGIPSIVVAVSTSKVETVQVEDAHESAVLRLESEVAAGQPHSRATDFSALPTRGEMTIMAHPAPGPTRTAASMHTRAVSAPVARMPTFTLGEWAQWLPRAMHMNVQGQQVRASVRDDQLDEAQAQQLFYRMRTQLQTWGLDLIELVVNGHPAQPEQAHASQHKARNHGS